MTFLLDIPEKWTDVPEKIYKDIIGTPKEIMDMGKDFKQMYYDIEGLKTNISNINSFIDRFENAISNIVDIFNMSLYDFVDTFSYPFTYFSISGGILLIMFGCPKWGSRFCKIGSIGFLIAHTLLAIQRGISG